MTKSICILSFSEIARDARVLRQVKYLSPHYDLTVIGYGEAHPAWAAAQNIAWKPVSMRSSLRMKTKALTALALLGKLSTAAYDRWYWEKDQTKEALKQALDSEADAYHANDWNTLPIAAEAAKKNKARLLFDAHEYAPLEVEDNWRWRFLYQAPINHFLRKYTPLVDASTTVASLIARKYQQEFGINPVVVLNAPDRVDVPSKELDPQNIRLVHHGIAGRGRRLEKMIEAVALCDKRYSLHFMLMNNDPGYLGHLKQLASEKAPGRVTFLDPVAPAEIVAGISQYTMGFYLLEPSNFNNGAAMPNKFFDFINAGLAVCIGPSPAMAELVREHGFGCVAPTFEPRDVAAMLNKLTTEQLITMRQAAREAAKQFNAETEMAKVVELYRQLLS